MVTGRKQALGIRKRYVYFKPLCMLRIITTSLLAFRAHGILFPLFSTVIKPEPDDAICEKGDRVRVRCSLRSTRSTKLRTCYLDHTIVGLLALVHGH